MRKGNQRWLLLSILVVVVDALSKAWIKKQLLVGMSYALLPLLNVTLAYNRGAAFSFLNTSDGWQQWLFGLIALVVVIILLAWMVSLPRSKNWQAAAAALIIGGAIGNLISRVYYGYVVDFIDFHLGSWHWPAFNVADSAIFVGVVMLIFSILKKR